MIPEGPAPFRGVYAATPAPLTSAFALDEPSLRALLAELAAVPGLAGFLVNGHAGENPSMPLADQCRVVEIAAETVGGRSTVIAGVNVENSLAAAAHARDVETAGADALMVFAPNGWALFQDEETALIHHRRILDATAAPIVLFQASVGAGAMAYPPQTLRRLVRLPRVAAIKEGSWEVAAYEANRRLIREAAPHVAVMGSGDEHLFTSFAVGSEGSIVSLAAVVPEAVIALFDSVRAGDLAAAREWNERIFPLARAIYHAPPGGRANARLKTCLKMTGRFPEDVMLPPHTATPRQEHEALRAALTIAHAEARVRAPRRRSAPGERSADPGSSRSREISRIRDTRRPGSGS